MRCIWDFLNDPQNRLTLQWIAGGVTALASAIWGVVVFFWLHRSQTRRHVLSKTVWIAVGVSALVILSVPALIIGWAYVAVADLCPDCWTFTKIKITVPRDGEEVSSPVKIIGTSTPHSVCRYVYVFVRGESGEEIAIEVTQTLDEGRWSASPKLDPVKSGEEARIHAVLIDRSMYSLHEPLTKPPVHGSPSNPVVIRRQK